MLHFGVQTDGQSEFDNEGIIRALYYIVKLERSKKYESFNYMGVQRSAINRLL